MQSETPQSWKPREGARAVWKGLPCTVGVEGDGSRRYIRIDGADQSVGVRVCELSALLHSPTPTEPDWRAVAEELAEGLRDAVGQCGDSNCEACQAHRETLSAFDAAVKETQC